MLPPPVGFLPVACLESLPRPLVNVFNELIDFRRVGYYKVRVSFSFYCFVLLLSNITPLHRSILLDDILHVPFNNHPNLQHATHQLQ